MRRFSYQSKLLKDSYLAYLLMTLLIFLQGSYALSGNRVSLIILLFIAAIIFIFKNNKIDAFLLIITLFLVIINISQTINFGYFSIYTFLGTLVRFMLPYFFVKIIKHKLLEFYVNILYFLTIISLLLYVPSALIPQFHDWLLNFSSSTNFEKLNESHSLIVYTVETSTRLGIIRNSGLFWEPGAHSGFLIIALMFSIVLSKRLWSSRNVLFILTILTTFSTAGYIALFLVIFFYYFVNIQNKISYIIIPLLILIAWFTYFRLDFLGERIDSEIQVSETMDEKYTGRIGSGKKDIEDIMKYPLFGRGRNVATRFEDYNEDQFMAFHRTNGVTDFIVKYGLLFSLFYFYYIYKSLYYFCIQYNFNKRFAFYMLLTILTIGFSQTFFQGTFFISLIYFHVVARKHILVNRRIALINAKFKTQV